MPGANGEFHRNKGTSYGTRKPKPQSTDGRRKDKGRCQPRDNEKSKHRWTGEAGGSVRDLDFPWYEPYRNGVPALP